MPERAARTLLFILLLNLLLIFISLLPLCLNNSGRNPVQVPLTVLANSPATVCGLLEDTNLLERLANLALHRGGRIAVV